jgi:hypothetical protein
MFSKHTFGARNYGPGKGLFPAAKMRLAKRRLIGSAPDSQAVKERGRAKLAKALEKQRAVREKRFQAHKLK